MGECLAARAARARGLTLVARDVRTPAGQVDLLLHDAGVLVCAEVKTASSDSLTLDAHPDWRPGRRFDRRRAARQSRAAAYLARALGYAAHAWRVDLIEVWIERSTGRSRCLHHEDLGLRPGPEFNSTSRPGR